jgi:hypothetical protein
MATGHWVTNKGKLYIASGNFVDASGTWRMGLIKDAQPAAYDTQAEVQQLNFVSDLLSSGTGTAVEATFSGYVRKTLASLTLEEDDTNNRINFKATSVTWTAAGSGNTLYGAFIYDTSVGSADTSYPLISVDWFITPVATNGGDVTYTITDLYRLT